MSTELLFLLLLVALVLVNVALEFIARWRNPPTGEFIDYSASWKNSSSGNNLRNAELVSEPNPRECTKNSRNSMNCFTTGSETIYFADALNMVFLDRSSPNRSVAS